MNRGRRDAVSTRTEPQLGYPLPRGGQQPGENGGGEPWCRSPAGLFPGMEKIPSDSRVLESSPYQHLQRVRRDRQTLFRMKLLSEMHLRARTYVSLKQDEPSRGAQYPSGRNLLSDTFYPERGSRTPRRRKERRGAVRSRISSPCSRACPPTIVVLSGRGPIFPPLCGSKHSELGLSEIWL